MVPNEFPVVRIQEEWKFTIAKLVVHDRGLFKEKEIMAELLEAWLALTSVKYHDNLLVLMPFNQWLALTMLRTTGPISLNYEDIYEVGH